MAISPFHDHWITCLKIKFRQALYEESPLNIDALRTVLEDAGVDSYWIKMEYISALTEQVAPVMKNSPERFWSVESYHSTEGGNVGGENIIEKKKAKSKSKSEQKPVLIQKRLL